MKNTFNDGYTQMLNAKMNDWGLDKIYEIDDNIEKLEENETEIINYLKDIRCSMPLGLAMRRYMCGKYGKKFVDNGNVRYEFTLSDNKNIIVSDYMSADYDLEKNDVEEYISVFIDVNARYNGDKELSFLSKKPKVEIRRLLRSTTYCLRSKMFLISFALHMNNQETEKFLTDVLAEQTYNFRDPNEIIAYYCQRDESVNSYDNYLRIKEKFSKSVKNIDIEVKAETIQYTQFANEVIKLQIDTENELIDFLVSNTQNFAGYSQTAYNEFMIMYDKALKKTVMQNLSNDDYVAPSKVNTFEQRKEQSKRINNARELSFVENTEQLAKEMLKFIPRANKKSKVKGKEVISSDFINISNGESGQKSKKVQTTTLPKEITMNMLISDRLDDLISQKKPVLRKDLVFMKFYIFGLDLMEKNNYLQADYLDFIDECNDMLLRCGMSRLYLANRFENLVLLSLASAYPFEMFENIMEYSFINEPSSID